MRVETGDSIVRHSTVSYIMTSLDACIFLNAFFVLLSFYPQRTRWPDDASARHFAAYRIVIELPRDSLLFLFCSRLVALITSALSSSTFSTTLPANSGQRTIVSSSSVAG